MATKKTEAADDPFAPAAAGKKDPVGEAQKPEKLEIVEGGPRDPYPTGKGRDPEEDFKAAHGYARAKE